MEIEAENVTSDVMWNLIKTNDFETVDTILSNLKVKDRKFMLNGIYINEEEEVKEDIKKSIFDHLVSVLRGKNSDLRDESRPLFTCIIFGSFDVLKVLLKYEVSLLQVAERIWNIIHYLISVSHHDTSYEPKAVSIYGRLRKELDKHKLKELLLMDDKYGLRPLEFAIHASCVQLFHSIVKTPGVYLVKRERQGLLETSWYDVDDYENQNLCNSLRFDKSQVKLLSFLDRQRLKSPKSVRLLRKGMIKEWCSAKIKCKVMFIIIWCILRILLVVSFYVTISKDIDYLIQIPLLTRGKTQPAEQMSTPTLTQTNITSKVNTMRYDDVTTPEVNVTFPFNVLRARTCESRYIHGWYYDLQEAFDLSDGYWSQLRIILGFVIYLFLYMIGSLIFDTISMLNITIVNRHKSWSNFLGKSKDRVVACLFYKMCQSSFTVWSLMYLSYSFG